MKRNLFIVLALLSYATAQAQTISFDLGRLPMTSAEEAGIEAAKNWNSLEGKSGFAEDIKDSNNVLTPVTAAWDGAAISVNPAIAIEDGDTHMMAEYLDATPDKRATVTLFNVNRAMAGRPYTIIVYCDGDNGWSARTGAITVNGKEFFVRDTKNWNYSNQWGEEARGADQVLGDAEELKGPQTSFVRVSGLTDATIEIVAEPRLSTDNYPRACINGIQILPD